MVVLFLFYPYQPLLPGYHGVYREWHSTNARLVDRHRQVLHELRIEHTTRRLSWIRLEQISPLLRQAVIAAEDRRFFQHHGVDVLAMLTAVTEYLRGTRQRGASTISMQLAALLDPELSRLRAARRLPQKLRQIRLALSLEQSWTKPQILEVYLNLISFRGELQGIDAAARNLFGKPPDSLDQAEALILAVLIRAPNASSEKIARRACVVARQNRFDISCQQLRQVADAMSEHPARAPPSPALAPQLAQRLLHHADQTVRVTLDKQIQQLTLQSLRQQLGDLAERNVRDGAALVVDNASGEVLAYVGSSGPHSNARWVDGVRARRQAGSTLKPWLYELALEQRYLTAASLLQDAPVNLETLAGLYTPHNYDREFRGWISMRTALASSLNIPAIRTVELIRLERFHGRLRDLGYGGLQQDPEYYGAALALGSAEVSLWEQVNAYRTLANGGKLSQLRLKPEDTAGPVRQLLPPEAVYIITDILSDRASRSPSFGLANVLSTPYPSAVKTGTSKDMRDNWCLGYTPKYTVGVWVGNFEGDAMRSVSGVTGAAPAWREIMDGLVSMDQASLSWSVPEKLVARKIQFHGGQEPPRQEWFIAGTEQSVIRQIDTSYGHLHIGSPTNGEVIAIDPDIPAERQMVLFTTQADSQGFSWSLDGTVMGPSRLLKWKPVTGMHELSLVDTLGRVQDRVRFWVKGQR